MHIPAPGVKIGNSTRSNNKEERNLMDFMEIPDQVKKKRIRKIYTEFGGIQYSGQGNVSI